MRWGESVRDQAFSPRGWRESLLGRVMIAVAAFAFSATTAVVVAVTGNTRVLFATFVYPVCVAFALMAFMRRWPYHLRAMTLVGGFTLITFFAYGLVGFQGGPALVGSLAVIFAGLFLGRRAMLLVLLVAALAPIVAAVGMLGGWLDLPEPHLVALDGLSPWLRTTFVAVTVWTLLGMTVTHVVSQIEQAVADAHGSLQSLRAEQVRRERADSQRREAEQAALQSQKLEVAGQLAAGVAHDFNNLLAVVQGWGALGLSPEASAADRAEALDALTASVRQGAALSRQLLTFCRRNVRTVAAIALADAVDVSLRALRRILPEDIAVAVEHGHTGPVDADETELQQVMFNLVINARDAMPGGGRLTITTGTESFPAPRPAAGGGQLAAGRWRFVRVDDTGPGIDPGSRERIFEPFFTTKPVGVGTGLGLWTVLSIASASGGGVLVGGEPGQGARLTVYFPEPATQAVVARAPMAVVAPPRATASRILLLEDDTSVRRLMTTVLERAGHQVVAVGDGRKALEEIARRGEHFDLLCSDAVVPQVPAGRVIDAFLAAFPSRPVLVVSGYVEEELTRNGIEQGRCHLLRKPFPPEELCRTVDRLQVAPA